MGADTTTNVEKGRMESRDYRAARGRVWKHEWENAREICRGEGRGDPAVSIAKESGAISAVAFVA